MRILLVGMGLIFGGEVLADDMPCVRQSQLLVCAGEPERVEALVEQVEFALKDLRARLGPWSDDQPLEVREIEDPASWEELLARLDVRHPGVALQVENKIYLYAGSEGEGRYLGLFHELVHYVMWAKGFHDLPLWAEEGAAQYYAWNIAQRFSRSRKSKLTRNPGVVALDSLFSQRWEEVAKRDRYPDDPQEAREFYQCAEYAVGAILKRLRIDQHAYMWEEYNARPDRLEFILNRVFGWTEKDWNSVDNSYQRQIQKSRRRR